MPAPQLLQTISGLVLLVAGRKLFWLFVGISGFLAGLSLGEALMPHMSSGSISWLIPVIGGVVGTLMAFLLQRLAVAVGGFFAGGYLALLVVERFHLGLHALFSYVIGGIVGTIFLTLVFDWALVFFSALVGATLVTPALAATGTERLWVFLVLSAVGMIIQGKLLKPAELKAYKN